MEVVSKCQKGIYQAPRKRRARVYHALLAISVFGAMGLSGCSVLSPYSDVTKLDVTLRASDQLNPDINGRPSPVVVRLMELSHPAAFQASEFFGLYGHSVSSLGQDLVGTEELELRPGETVNLKLSVGTGSRYVGVLAAYRDLADSQWRYVIALHPRGLNSTALSLDDSGIHEIDDQPHATGRRS